MLWAVNKISVLLKASTSTSPHQNLSFLTGLEENCCFHAVQVLLSPGDFVCLLEASWKSERCFSQAGGHTWGKVQRCFFENLCLKVGVVGNAVQVNGEARADISEMRTSMCGNTRVRWRCDMKAHPSQHTRIRTFSLCRSSSVSVADHCFPHTRLVCLVQGLLLPSLEFESLFPSMSHLG